ncbi:MAG: 4-hydroxy-tetrahydrodipicolinate reductase [Sphaerochaeta sp.]|nr:4-hydroxy-tetrahydrodipicolinate reductase [Sphaerochaeta sp.]MDX9915940.1 4-hydroxy-tetrahydrodipicolinate reductase [Sphaerochaeta sp.]
MTRVIIHGCSGRMGAALTEMAAQIPDIEVVAGIDIHPSERPYPIFDTLSSCAVTADVMIDFSSPESLPLWMPEAQKRGLALVIATTGHSPQELAQIDELSQSLAIFRSGNMSLGINLVQQLVKEASKVLGEQYDVEIIEKHHKEKKDAPSGTALMLAESVNDGRVEHLQYTWGRHGSDVKRKEGELGIHSVRGGTIVGEHEISFYGKDEAITIDHRITSRQVFATGALFGARYIANKKSGLYSMADMITERSAVTTLLAQREQVLISLEHIPRDMALVTELYGSLAHNDVFIDMISHTGAANGYIAIAFTINEGDILKATEVVRAFQSAHGEVSVNITEGITKLTVEGPGMEFQSGVAYRVFSTMATAHIPIFAVTTSESKIAYAIYSTDVSSAVAIIKEEFAI